jgi:hypothetical protein
MGVGMGNLRREARLNQDGRAPLRNLLAPPQEYEKLLGALRQRIRSAQLDALCLVNREQISSRGVPGIEWVLCRQSLANEELL